MYDRIRRAVIEVALLLVCVYMLVVYAEGQWEYTVRFLREWAGG